jgi:hypothetical protein
VRAFCATADARFAQHEEVPHVHPRCTLARQPHIPLFSPLACWLARARAAGGLGVHAVINAAYRRTLGMAACLAGVLHASTARRPRRRQLARLKAAAGE